VIASASSTGIGGRQQHGACRVQELGGLGHEAHAADHDRAGSGVGARAIASESPVKSATPAVIAESGSCAPR
jgi:hypothetical protein